jgi:hypothetical protein
LHITSAASIGASGALAANFRLPLGQSVNRVFMVNVEDTWVGQGDRREAEAQKWEAMEQLHDSRICLVWGGDRARVEKVKYMGEGNRESRADTSTKNS